MNAWRGIRSSTEAGLRAPSPKTINADFRHYLLERVQKVMKSDE